MPACKQRSTGITAKLRAVSRESKHEHGLKPQSRAVAVLLLWLRLKRDLTNGDDLAVSLEGGAGNAPGNAGIETNYNNIVCHRNMEKKKLLQRVDTYASIT